MTTRSPLRYGLYIVCGFGILLSALFGLRFPSHEGTPMYAIVQIASGLFLVGLGGYGYWRPEKTNSFQALLLGAIVGFLLVVVLAFFLLHFYGLSSFFSTAESTSSFGFTVLMLIVSVWMLWYAFSLRRKEPR